MTTIGTGSGIGSPDYPDIETWWFDAPATLSADYIGQILWSSAANEILTSAEIVFEGTDPNGHQIILEAATGDSFFENIGAPSTALRYSANNGACWRMTSGSNSMLVLNNDGVILRNLQMRKDSAFGIVVDVPTAGFSPTIERMIFDQRASERCLRLKDTSVSNTLIYHSGDAVSTSIGMDLTTGGGSITNSTVVRLAAAVNATGLAQSYGTWTVRNSIVLGFSVDASGTLSGSHNSTDKSSLVSGLPSTNLQTDLVGATEFEAATIGSEDFRLKSTSAKCKDNGTSSGAPTPPTTDIIGQSRSGTPDIGCWEFQAAATGRRPTLTMLGIGA
jgi:hypothetical protein